MNTPASWSKADFQWSFEPDYQSGLGVATNLQLSPPVVGEHARQIVASFDTPESPASIGGCIVDIIYQRVAGLDLHKETIVAAVRRIGAGGESGDGSAYLRYHDPRSSGTVGLVGGLRRDACRHGSHGSLVEAGVEHLGRPFRVVAGQPAGTEAGSRPQERRQGRPMDCAVAAARLAAQQFRAGPAAARVAGLDPPSCPTRGRTHAGRQSHPQALGGRQHQIGRGGQRYPGRFRARDAGPTRGGRGRRRQAGAIRSTAA